MEGYFAMKKIFHYLRHFLRDFFRLGFTGWCIEILFTAIDSFRRREFTLKGTTSLWMFPIYGLGALIGPLSRCLQKKCLFVRGFYYMLLIYVVELCTGRFLQKRKFCPWNYHSSSWNIQDVIRLDYAPFWFLTGLLFEKITQIPFDN